jgi:glycosyltransferase involved in cell wall biosynthesis
VIASDIGNFSEVVQDGAQGLLAPPADAAAFAAAMARMLSDRAFAAACALEARRSVARIPDWTRIGRDTAEVYAQAGARLRPGAA